MPLLGFEPRSIPPQGTILSRLDYRGEHKALKDIFLKKENTI